MDRPSSWWGEHRCSAGRGRCGGRSWGCSVLATLSNIFYSLDVDSNWQLVAKGTIIVAAVALDSLQRRTWCLSAARSMEDHGMNRIRSLFGERKPVIAMAHVPPLPGDPAVRRRRGVGVDRRGGCRSEILLAADVDAVMFCNEDDRPYLFSADLGRGRHDAGRRVARAHRPSLRRGLPLGAVPMAALSIAVACGAAFIREVVTGAYESDMGIWRTDAAALLRERRRLDADGLATPCTPLPSSPHRSGRETLPHAHAQSRCRACPMRSWSQARWQEASPRSTPSVMSGRRCRTRYPCSSTPGA